MQLLFIFFVCVCMYVCIYLFGCVGSWLRHAGSLLRRAGSFIAVRGLSCCGAGLVACGMWDLSLTAKPSKVICHFLVPPLRFSSVSLVKLLKFYYHDCFSGLGFEVLFESLAWWFSWILGSSQLLALQILLLLYSLFLFSFWDSSYSRIRHFFFLSLFSSFCPCHASVCIFSRPMYHSLISLQLCVVYCYVCLWSS